MHVLSLFVPGRQRFYHKHIRAGQNPGEFAIGESTGTGLVEVCGAVAEVIAANSGAAGAAPVLRNTGAASLIGGAAEPTSAVPAETDSVVVGTETDGYIDIGLSLDTAA